MIRVAMPGGKVNWPFDNRPRTAGFTPSYRCPKCGAYAVEARPHVRLSDIDKVRKSICFGK